MFVVNSASEREPIFTDNTARSVAFTVAPDSTPPAAPIVTSPGGPGALNTLTLTLTGTAEANAAVRVWADRNANGVRDTGEPQVGLQQLQGGGTSFAIQVTLTPDSVNRFVLTATDIARQRV